MKKAVVFILIVFYFGIAGFQPVDRKTQRAKAKLEMAQLIESGRFRFVVQSANSELGSFTNLSSNYEMVFDSLHIKSFLPYFGVAYSVPYGGSDGVKFDLNATQIDRDWNERKKIFTFSLELTDPQDSYSIVLTAGLTGYADLKINFKNKRWFSYYGTIENLETQKSQR